MRVLISTEIKELPGYTVYNHITNITWISVDALVFHSCTDTDLETVFALGSLPAGVKTIIYINKNIDSLLFNLVKGIKGYVYNDEAFLADKDSLDFLIENAGSIGMEVESASADVAAIEEFVDAVTNGDSASVTRLMSNPNWLDTLQVTLNNMTTSLAITDQSSTKIVEFVDNVSRHIDSIEAQNKKNAEEIKRIRETVGTLNAKAVGQQALSGNISSPMKYGTYTVPNIIKNVVYIRCFGDVNYLTTFILALQGWLGASRNGKNTPSKVLIARPQFSNYMSRYSKIAKITNQSAGMLDIKKASVFITFEPNKKVMDAFFKDTSIPLFFVLDFMQSDSPLCMGHMLKTFNAYSSPRIYNNLSNDKNKAPLSRSIFSIDGVGDGSQCLVIPYIEEFHTMTDSEKKQSYFKYCRNLYERLWNVIDS